jgi:hypothetical protein
LVEWSNTDNTTYLTSPTVYPSLLLFATEFKIVDE